MIGSALALALVNLAQITLFLIGGMVRNCVAARLRGCAQQIKADTRPVRCRAARGPRRQQSKALSWEMRVSVQATLYKVQIRFDLVRLCVAGIWLMQNSLKPYPCGRWRFQCDASALS